MGATDGSTQAPSASWCCSGCGEVHEAEWETCWKCGGARGDALADGPASTPATTVEPDEKRSAILSGLDGSSFGIVWVLQWLCLVGAILVHPAHTFLEYHYLWELDTGLIVATVALLVAAVLLAVISRLIRRVESLEARLGQRRK